MIRTPLRPLARILSARARGENPDVIERENLRRRHEIQRERDRGRAESRLVVMAVLFAVAFGMVGLRMGQLAQTEPAEPRAQAGGTAITAARADIIDRNGRVLATNLVTQSLYAQPWQMIDPARAARALVRIFPDLDAARLEADFRGARKFLWIKRRISPEQQQQVHDIGEPGLLFGPREMRLYPNGRLAAHVLGGAGFGREGVSSAEITGTAGVEKAFDAQLSDPARAGTPLRLTLDLTVQAALEEVLASGVRLFNAKGAAAILMDARTGEIVAMASLPDFDPNTRPAPPVTGEPADSPLFNRAVQGVYELGSTFKVFTVAQAMALGLVNARTLIDTKGPLAWGRFRISDIHKMDPQLSVEQVLVQSSNVGTARIAMMIGGERQRAFLTALGLTEPTGVELAEARSGRPQLPPKWSDISTMTIGYGHGMATSPLHLAAAYATVANGGLRVEPTLIPRTNPVPGPRVLDEATAQQMRGMMRKVVSEGTATMADVAGYEVGGKTGTAEKVARTGGYDSDRVVATFAGVFPASDPKYVLVVTLDEAVETSGEEPRRTAGWTAVPVAAELIRRTAPLLGLRPKVEQLAGDAVTLVTN